MLPNDNLNIGDIVAASSSCFFERRIAAFGPVSKRLGIEETSTWAFTSSVAEGTQDDLRDASIARRVAVGKMASGRSFSTDATGLAWLNEMGCMAKDMETAATVSTCVQFGIPATSLRVIADVIDHATEIQTFYSQRPTCVPILVAATRAFCHRALARLDRQPLSLLSASPTGIVALHVAMVEEAEPIAAALGMSARVIAPFSTYGIRCWVGTSANGGVPLVMVAHGKDDRLGMSRVSTEIATFVTNVLVRTYGSRLKCVINCGTAGAMCAPGDPLEIGSVVIADRVAFFDARGLDSGHLNQHLMNGTGSFIRTAESKRTHLRLRLWEEASRALVSRLAKTHGVRAGAVGTGSSFDSSDADLESLRAMRADVKEMEAASVVWTLNQFDVPAVLVKSVTDFVEHEAEGADEFAANLLGKARESLTRVVPAVIDTIVGLL